MKKQKEIIENVIKGFTNKDYEKLLKDYDVKEMRYYLAELVKLK